MRKKTKFLTILLIAAIALFAATNTAASCKKDPPVIQHVCSFEDTWTYNQSEHWHKCIGEGECDKVSDKAAHTWNNGEVTKEPTYTEKGEKTYTCTVCPATKTEELPAKQHVCSFEDTWTYNQTEHWHKCIGEGECDKVSDKAAHTWNDGKVTKEPTFTEKGEKTYTCTVCPATKTEETASVPLPDENEAWNKMLSAAEKAKANDAYGVRVYGAYGDTLDQGTYKQEFVFNADGKSASKIYSVDENGIYTAYTALMQYGGKYYRAEAINSSSAFTVTEVKEITEYFAKTSAKTSKIRLDKFIGSKEKLIDSLIEHTLYSMYWSEDKDGNPVTVTKEDITVKVIVKGSGSKIIIELIAEVNAEKIKKMWYEGANYTSYIEKLSYTFGDDAFCIFEFSNDNSYVKDGKTGSLWGVQSIEMLASPDYAIYDQAIKATDLSSVDLSEVEPYIIDIRVHNDIYALSRDGLTSFNAAVTENAYTALGKKANDIIYKIERKLGEKLTARFYADQNKTIPIDENYKFGFICRDLGLITTVYIDIAPADKNKVLATYTYEKRSVSEDGSSNAQTRNEYVLVDKNSDYEIATGYMYEYFDDEITVNGEKITDKKVNVGEKNLAVHCLILLGPDADTDFITNHINCTESDEYGFDENNHWKKCTAYGCDNKLKLGAHQWDGGVIIEEATEQKPGVKKYTCEICGYDKNQSYTITPDVPDPVDPAAAAFEKMLAAAEKTRKNKPDAVKKNFYLGSNGMSSNTETVVFADGRTATKQVTLSNGNTVTENSYLSGANGKYYNKKSVSGSNGSKSFTNYPVPKSFADTAYDVLFEQMFDFCPDKKTCETYYPLMLKNSCAMGVFDRKTGEFAVPELSDVEYNITCATSLSGNYDSITVLITIKDEYLKSVIGGGGETISMISFVLTVKYNDLGIVGAAFYQGVSYTKADGVTTNTNEGHHEFIPLRGNNEGVALYEEIKADVDSGTSAEEGVQYINIGIKANGSFLHNYAGSYDVNSPALYAGIKSKIDSFVKMIETAAPGKFRIEAFTDENLTVAFDENYAPSYYDAFFTPCIYLKVTSVGGEDGIALYSYKTTGSDRIFTMGGGEKGTRTVVFKKTDSYKIETLFEAQSYGDLICINDIYTKSDVYDASNSALLVIECHKKSSF